MIALSSMLGIQQVEQLVRSDKRRLQTDFITNAIVWLSSCTLATVLTSASIALAIWSRTKIWISRSISESRRRNEWPPQVTQKLIPDTNLLRSWFLATGIAIFVPPLLLGVWSILSSNPGTPSDHAGDGNSMRTLLIASLPFIGVGFVFWFGNALYQRLGAKNADECWRDDSQIAEPNPSG